VAKHDERIASSALISLAGAESRHNMKEASFVYPDGTRDPFTMGVPRAWENPDRLPKAGILYSRYVCSPQERKFATRLESLQRIGCWQASVQEEEVLWWASLAEAPEDVLTFLYFLISTGRYDNLMDAFLEIDGADGNGVISKKEFVEGLKNMDCKKFRKNKKGKKSEADNSEEEARIVNIFRFLDPSGEGEVSKDEWMILLQFWNEIRQSIREFVDTATEALTATSTWLGALWTRTAAARLT